MRSVWGGEHRGLWHALTAGHGNHIKEDTGEYFVFQATHLKYEVPFRQESNDQINNNFYLTIAVAVSIGIFFVAGQISGTLKSTGLHWIAHIAAYAFLGACYAKGLPRSTVVMVTLLTAGIGGLHELYEVGRYGIDLELHDLFYDIVGAFADALLVSR